MKDKSNCFWYFVLNNKFTEFWSNDIIDFEPAEGGWIFWELDPTKVQNKEQIKK